MSTKRPTITAVKFHKEGIRVVFDDGLEMHAGDPIQHLNRNVYQIDVPARQ